MRNYHVWTDADEATVLRILGQHTQLPAALAAISQALGRRVSRASVDKRLDASGRGTAYQQLNKRPLDAAPAPAPAPAYVPPPADIEIPITVEEPEEAHPLEQKEARDAAHRIKRQLDQVLEELQATRARHAFLYELDRGRPPPRILPREKTSGIRELTAVAAASDWHVEEEVDPASIAYLNAYSLDIAAVRIDRFFQSILWNVEHHRASGRVAIRDLILWLGGDLITGYIHEELLETNALSPTQTLMWLMPRISGGIRGLLDTLNLEHIEVPCSYGNHGRTTPKRRVSSGHANSFEWLMYATLAREFAGDPRVHFEVTPSPHQYVEAYDFTLHFHHGDELRYAGGVGGLGIPLLKRVPVWDRIRPAHVHVIGHFHQLRDYGRAVVNGALVGYNGFAQSIGADPEPAQQAMFYIDSKRGKCWVTSLWVDESPVPRGRAA